MSEGGKSVEAMDSPAGSGSGLSVSRKLLGRYRHVMRVGLMLGAVVIDLVVIGLSGMLVTYVRQGGLMSSGWVQAVSLLLPTYLLAALALRAYEMRSLRSLARAIFSSELALGAAAAIAFSLAFALKVGEELSRLETGFTIVVAAILLVLVRIVGTAMLRRTFHAALEQHIVVLTDGSGIQPHVDEAMTSMIDVRQLGIIPALSDPAFFNRIGRVGRDADRVILAFEDRTERLKWAEAMRLSGLDAEMVADVGDVQPIALSNWRNHSTLVISRGPLNLGERLLAQRKAHDQPASRSAPRASSRAEYGVRTPSMSR